eukprot:1140381-Pelagomonas_calceolata.AAC.11
MTHSMPTQPMNLQTATTATTLPAGAVGGDGCHILCNGANTAKRARRVSTGCLFENQHAIKQG